MKIVNKNGLPQREYDLVCAYNKAYTKEGADVSVTELIDSPRIRILKKKHDDEIEVEADSLLQAALGQAFHEALAKHSTEGISERRLSIEVNGWKVSGSMDHYKDGVISDDKTCNVWKTVYSENGNIPEFEKQLNVYAHILRENNIPVIDLKIFALFKDWNRRGHTEAFKKNKIWVPDQQSGYPNKSWAHFSLKLWTPDVAKLYVLRRVIMHQKAEKELPLCSRDDLWSGSRCANYCNVQRWCDQYAKSKKSGLLGG